MKLLEIQSSPRGESSDSITLTKSFVEACKSDNTSIVVDTLNVWHKRLSLARGKGNRRLYTRFTFPGGYSNTALAIRSPSNLFGLLVAACGCSRSSDRDC